MRKSRFSEAQIIEILRQADAGMKVWTFAASTGSLTRRSTSGAAGTAASECPKRSGLVSFSMSVTRMALS